MRTAPASVLALAAAFAAPVAAEPDAVARCLSCHLTAEGTIDIVGMAAMPSLPAEWPLFFEDAYDIDGDGAAGRVQHVSGADGPLIARYGRNLAAARFEDFAKIAGAAHGIDLSDPATIPRVEAAFAARSPDPVPPPPDVIARFEARGCAACHVTDTYQAGGRDYMPLSDFLLHDLGDGPVRTAPLWGCIGCMDGPGHTEIDGGRGKSVSRN